MDRIIIDGIIVEITRKRIKHMYLRITPTEGNVKISSPKNMSHEYIKDFVLSKITWIKRHQERVRSRKRYEPVKFETGERISFDGRVFELKVTSGKGRAKVLLGNDFLELSVNDPGDYEHKKNVLERFYRKHMKELIPVYISKWEPVMNVKVNFFNVKRMKTKWGTYNTQRGRIWLNLELAKKDRSLLEYVVVHEMVHLLERNHSKRFYGFMDKFMPEWKDLRKKLNGEVD